MSAGKGKEDYYKGEDWVSKGDAYMVKDGKSQAPHLDQFYRCPCGGTVQVAMMLVDYGETVECLTYCKQPDCKRFHTVLLARRHYKGGKA